jgi:putative flippase GtrA
MTNKKIFNNYSKNFVKFILAGAIWTIIPIIMAFFLIDFLIIQTLLASIIIVLTSFFGKYFTYIYFTFLKKRVFYKYILIQSISSIANVTLMVYFVETLNLSGTLSAVIIAIALLFFRFMSFYLTNAVIHK